MTSPPRARPTEAIETLRAARALLSKPQRWCRGSTARTSRGEEVEADDPRAARFCAVGAVERVAGRFRSHEATGALRDALELEHDDHFLSEWNDDPRRKHAEVVALFDRAIAQAEGT